MKAGEPFVAALSKHLKSLGVEERLRIEDTGLFHGPNPYAPRPAIVCRIFVTGRVSFPGSMSDAIAALLIDNGRLPIEDRAPTSDAGPLVEWAGRRIAALMQEWLGLPLESDASKAPTAGDGFCLWIELYDVATAIASLRAAITILALFLEDGPHAERSLRSELSALQQLCLQRRPSPETQLMIAAARACGIPVLHAGTSSSMWQFGWGARSELFWVTSSNRDGLVGARIGRFKHYQKKLFEGLGLPTPAWLILPPTADIASALRHIGFPCVVKPINQSGGRGVTANITSMEMLTRAIALARSLSSLILLEAHQPGHDHRLLVVNGRLEMAMRLDPPAVRGDGRRSVSQLVADLNLERATERGPARLGQVPVDESFELALQGQGFTGDSVPEAGKEVVLRTNANRATGGTAVNVLPEVHPAISRYAELLAQAAGFQTLGIDYVTPDISRSHEEVGGGFLEINATPGMARVIAEGLVSPEFARLVIGPQPGRVPTSLLIAPRDRLSEIGRKFATLSEDEAVAASDWARIGSVNLPQTTMRPTDRILSLLRYRSVASLMILWTPEEVCEWGLPVDRLDRIVLLDAALDPSWFNVIKSHAHDVSTARGATEAIRLMSRRRRSKKAVDD